jgi:hypothetical protein
MEPGRHLKGKRRLSSLLIDGLMKQVRPEDNGNMAELWAAMINEERASAPPI